MERGKSTDFILKQFKRKSKRAVRKDLFTEFFYLNRERRVIEFLKDKDRLSIEVFFKEFLPKDFRDFVSLKVYNDVEEEIRTWYYDEENIIIVIDVNWGTKKQRISSEIDIDTFTMTVVDHRDSITRSVDYVLLNDHLISFLTSQARALAETYEVLAKRRGKNDKSFDSEKERKDEYF